MKTTAAAILALALLGAALAAAGGAAAARHAKHRRTVVELRATTLGKVLVDAKGRTLYLYARDRKDKSTCYGGCASAWLPLRAAGKRVAAKGLKAKLLGVAIRTGGMHQITYKGHPLYRYAGDSKPGQVNGEGVAGAWYAVNAAGNKVGPKTMGKASHSTTTTGHMGAGSGYGY